jgi:hypothetical protein
VHNLAILKNANNVTNHLTFADMSEELIAETFAMGGTLDQTGNIDEFDRRGDDFRGLIQLSELIETRVRDRHDADIRLDGGEGIISRKRTRVGKRIKKRGFTYIRETDDANLEINLLPFYLAKMRKIIFTLLLYHI